MNDPRLPVLLSILPGSETCDPRWLAVEAGLGLSLPRSYKALVDQFGASTWSDFLHVLSPFEQRPGLEFRRRSKEILDADRESREQFPSCYPLPLYPEPGGVLPWGISDNGDTLYFVTHGAADSWPTMIKGSRAPEFEVSFLPPALLIHQFAAGRLRSTILPVPDRTG